MTIRSKRTPLGDAVALTEILDPKFKTNTILVRWFVPLSTVDAPAFALAGMLTAASNGVYRSQTEMRQKLHLLYGAQLNCTISRMGDIQCISLHASCITDKYAISGEAIFAQLLAIFQDCICHPNVTDGAYDATIFQIEHKNLLDSIDAEINEKRRYAIQRMYQTAFQGEPAAISAYGGRAQAEALTPENTYTAFQKLLQTARTEVYFVGPEAQPGLADMVRAIFAAIPNRCPAAFDFHAPSPCKKVPETVEESLPVNQCKMVLGWKTDHTDRYALKMMTLLLGGTPSAKLFANVREKMSLCYYCAASFVTSKQLLLVDSGIEAENIETAKAAILAQLEALCRGEISDEEWSSAQMSIHDTLHGIGDTPVSHMEWHIGQMVYGTDHTPEEEEQCYQQVTREQVIAAARSMQLDSIYLMKPMEQEVQTHGND